MKHRTRRKMLFKHPMLRRALRAMLGNADLSRGRTRFTYADHVKALIIGYYYISRQKHGVKKYPVSLREHKANERAFRHLFDGHQAEKDGYPYKAREEYDKFLEALNDAKSLPPDEDDDDRGVY